MDQTATPAFHSSNIFGSPAFTMAGIGFLGNVAQTVATQGLPVGPGAWLSFSAQFLAGLAGIFGKG